jgi:hypothetical protein
MKRFRGIIVRDSTVRNSRHPSSCRAASPLLLPPAMRRAIASAAARLMAEHGIADYGMAKRKAARSLGVGEGEALPTNEEIEPSCAPGSPLPGRRTARTGTRPADHGARSDAALADFRPYLTGGALDGTAGRYSAIEIELFADSSKDVEIALLSSGISYETMPNRRQACGFSVAPRMERPACVDQRLSADGRAPAAQRHGSGPQPAARARRRREELLRGAG